MIAGRTVSGSDVHDLRRGGCPHGERDGRYCPNGRCPVLLAPDDVLQSVAERDPLPGTLGETAKRYAVAELARRQGVR